MIDLGSRGAVDILARKERFHHRGVATHVGHQAQFDLRIVGCQQNVARIGNESTAYLAAILGSDRDILKIGIGGGYTSGSRHGLVERRVDFSCPRIDKCRQCIDVGCQQLAQRSDLQDEIDNRILGAQFFQNLFRGRVRATLGAFCLGIYLQTVEQHLTHLHGRRYVESDSGY